jgi:hypothetical protein
MKQKERHYTILSSLLSVDVHNHLEFGLCILEVHPVYRHSFQVKDNACCKMGGSGITVVAEIL